MMARALEQNRWSEANECDLALYVPIHQRLPDSIMVGIELAVELWDQGAADRVCANIGQGSYWAGELNYVQERGFRGNDP
jgi:hypothetical protein